MRGDTEGGKRKTEQKPPRQVCRSAALPLRKDLRGADNFPSINGVLLALGKTCCPPPPHSRLEPVSLTICLSFACLCYVHQHQQQQQYSVNALPPPASEGAPRS